jgi:hypothetical protein
MQKFIYLIFIAFSCHSAISQETSQKLDLAFVDQFQPLTHHTVKRIEADTISFQKGNVQYQVGHSARTDYQVSTSKITASADKPGKWRYQMQLAKLKDSLFTKVILATHLQDLAISSTAIVTDSFDNQTIEPGNYLVRWIFWPENGGDSMTLLLPLEYKTASRENGKMWTKAKSTESHSGIVHVGTAAPSISSGSSGKTRSLHRNYVWFFEKWFKKKPANSQRKVKTRKCKNAFN